jgi:hypothetical protein
MAARAAIVELTRQYGSQSNVAEKLGVSQPSVNKAILRTKVGPAVLRALLEHLQIDMPELLRRYGDPSQAPPGRAAPKAPPPVLSPVEEAIMTTLRFAPTAPESEVRAIADEYSRPLENAPAIEWLETLLREVQRRILIPQRLERGAVRKRHWEQRTLRKLQDAARVPDDRTEKGDDQKRSAR